MKISFTIQETNIHHSLTMRQAQPEHTEAVMGLLLETARWLKSKGSDQWSGLLEGKDSHDTPSAIERGEVFVAMDGEQVAGMVILMKQPSQWDYSLWGDKAHPEDRALYLHRLAINRQYANSGLGEAILRWCDAGIRFEGKDRVRLDCIANNPTLNAFYSGNGYRFVGTNGEFNIYEKPVQA
ncbi:GNAT family N-acetyltransferase [Paenibacillus campinasensis]|uniref:GNAT family N-acetyltransferase n=1 Tax=Paenibacillus campinasensis TaxID=66347 RepID=A0A268EUP3_9BACL|nr:GNAT family N-acetyltransferase [Paenibacillus campinasensis]PAD76846.1 GNAT family N-acetyltransferase [Paenibacillus campinasensis]